VEHLSNDLNWQVINDLGLAAGIVINEGNETDYSSYTYLPWLFLSDGQSLLLPHDPSSPIFPDWALLSCSNDGKILLRNFYHNEQFSWSYRFFLYDATTGKLDRIRMPAPDYSSVISLSNQNGRMLIQGGKPCQITPDGTCIRLDALRVTDENHGTPVPLRELYPNIITPSHISSEGRITLTTINTNGNNVIIQITNHNDANNDGLPDDWSQAHNVTNPDADDDGDGLSNRREYELGTDAKKADTDNDGIQDSIDGNPKVPATPTTDSDEDGVFDLEDAVPNDAEINWKKTPEAKYVWVEQVTHTNDANHIGPPIAINKDAQILFGLNLYSETTIDRTLWSSALNQWIQLPAISPEQYLLSETYPDLFIQNLSAEEIYDINDQGVIVGKSYAGFIEPIALISRILIWSKNPQNPNTYQVPRSYFSKFPIAFPHYAADYSNAAISDDGTINTTGQYPYSNSEVHWLTHHNTSVPQQASMTVQKNLGDNGSGIAGAILDRNRALLIEKSPNLLSLDKILLKENSGISNLTIMNDPTIKIAEMSELPVDKADKTPRLWITNGNSSWIEKRDGGVGAARWHKPASMEGEIIIRVSKQGVAITAGAVWQSIPPKLWRNGTYTNLNDSNLTAKPAEVIITNAIDIASNGIILVQATEGAVKKTGFLLPVEVIELSPKVKDEDGNDIAGSEKPNIGKPLSPFVEVDPHANKIAHRELKVKIGELLKDKKVTWTLEPLPGAIPATIRGEWEDSPTHKDRFEVSKAYGANGFRKVSQASGETTVGADGHTAIRVNVPPIGFNQVRIKIHIEGISTPIDLIDMEVPGVVVIDPGHGGQDSGAVGRTDTSILEKDLALEYSLSLQREVIEKFAAERHGLRMVMTRKTTGEYMENSARANLARDKGADVFISVHFNSGANSARGTETLVRGDSNVNESEDTTLANLFLTSTLSAVKSQDAAAVNRGVKNYAWSKSKQKNVPSQWAVLSDSGYGNTNDYHPIRGSIVEVEFLSHETALESVKLPNAKGTAIKTNFASDVSIDIYNNILNQP
jgi:N-acetylmuramoyl-L-alanine amidase